MKKTKGKSAPRADKRGRHVCLLVEDNAALAEEVRDRLDSMGFDCVIRGSREETLALFEGDDFSPCLIILDLQLKSSAESKTAHVEVGRTLLEELRRRFHQKNARGEYCLAILVMSGIAKGPHTVVGVMKRGADNFIIKPLGRNRTPFVDIVRKALADSGRESHERCAFVLREVVSLGTLERARVRLTGNMLKRRGEIVIGETKAHLQPESFVTLLKVAARRLTGEKDGLVYIGEIAESSANAAYRKASRLNNDVRPYLSFDVVQTDGAKHYRLNPLIDIEVNADALAEHSNPEVRRLAAEILALRG